MRAECYRLLLLAAACCSCGGATRSDDLGFDPAVPLSRAGQSERPMGTPVEGEWRVFRGNESRSGVRVAPAIRRPQIMWQASVGIQGYANTPLVTDDTVYVSSQGDLHNSSDPRDGIYALDIADGAQRWFYQTQWDINGAMLTDTLVVGGADNGHLVAVDRDTGAEVWVAEMDDPIRHAPIEVDGALYVNQSNRVAVLSPATGSVQYYIDAPEEDAWVMRGALADDGERLYRTHHNCGVSATEDGDTQWDVTACETAPQAWANLPVMSPPTVVEDHVLVHAPRLLGYEDADLRLTAFDAETGEITWSQPTEQSFDQPHASPGYDQRYFAAAPWVMHGAVWVPQLSRAGLVAFDLDTGRHVGTVTLPDCRLRQFPSIVGVPSVGYFARHDGNLYGFSPHTGELVWAIRLRYANDAGSNVTTATMGIGVHDTYCNADPWDGSGLFSTPAIAADGTLFVGSGEGFLYAIQDRDW